MASVQRRVQRGRVSYRATWVERVPGQRPRQRNKTFSSSSAAKQFAARMEHEIERRGIGDPERQTCAQYLDYWLKFLRDRGEKSPSTIQGYARCIATVCREIGEIPLNALSAVDLDRAYSRLLKDGGKRRNVKPGELQPLKARSVLHIHRCLHTALKQAKRWKLIAENPVADATAPSAEASTARAFSTDEQQRLLTEAARDPETYAIVATLMTCGLRRSELLGLAEDAIDFVGGTLEVRRVVLAIDGGPPLLRDKPKSKSSRRTLKIPPQLVELLRGQLFRVKRDALMLGKEYQRHPMLLFPGLAGAPLPPLHLTDWLRTMLRRVGITDAQPVHSWRHTAATSLFDAGHHVKTVQARLGHSTPAITLALYTHPVAERDQEAAEHFGRLIERE